MNNNIRPPLPQKTTFSFPYPPNHTITFDSAFDSGNCSLVQQLSSSKYHIHTANDCAGYENEGYSKSWFHFSVSGFPNGSNIEFNVWRINMVYGLRKYVDVYRPVYCMSRDNTWKRIDQPVQLNIIEEKLVVTFEFNFAGLLPEEKVFFAFSYPYSYEDSQKSLNLLQKQFLFDSEIYFHRETLIKSPEDRNIDLLTISSHEGKASERESYIKDSLFPNKKSEKRAFRFRENKPVILLTARVHPGEAPASHAMNGILKLLLDKKDARAHLLRKYFVFMIVPMINPDGVYNGYYRMDIYNQNLNRYYNLPKITKQPAIFAIRQLVGYLKSPRRLFFYCDLHAHSARKGCFLFGNALNDFVSQVESQLYAKVVGLNCINFEYQHCIFSKRHMKSKDRNEKLTKEGCGRVVVHKICSLVHSYTLECGFHLMPNKNPLNEPANQGKIIEKKFGFVSDPLEDINNNYYQNSSCFFSIEAYENVGKSLLVSILDIFEKNPYSRLENSKYKKISAVRKEIAGCLMTVERFKKNPQNFKKMRSIDEVSFESFYQQFQVRKVFEVPDNPLPIHNSSSCKSQSQEAKNFLAKSTSLRGDKDFKASSITFKTPGKKTAIFPSKNETKSASSLPEEEKNEFWDKERDREELINELREELEEESGDSGLSCDSEEFNDEEVKEITISQRKNKKESPKIDKNIGKTKEKAEKIHKSQQIFIKNNEKIINYPPFLREKK